MLLKCLPGIAGIFLGTLAAWFVLSAQSGPSGTIDLIAAFGIGLPVAFAYLALPYCRFRVGRKEDVGRNFFLALAMPTFVAVTCISIILEIPIWQDRAVGISVRDAPSRSGATLFFFTDATVRADKVGWGETESSGSGSHKSTPSYCVTMPLVPADWHVGEPVPAWARVSSQEYFTDAEMASLAALINGRPFSGFRIIGGQADNAACVMADENARKNFHLTVAARAPLIAWDLNPDATYRRAWNGFWIIDGIACGLVILFTGLCEVHARKAKSLP